MCYTASNNLCQHHSTSTSLSNLSVSDSFSKTFQTFEIPGKPTPTLEHLNSCISLTFGYGLAPIFRVHLLQAAVVTIGRVDGLV